MAQKTTIALKQGNTWLSGFQLETTEASPDYTGWRVEFMVKPDLAMDNTSAIINQTVYPDPVLGYAELVLTDEQTALLPVGIFFYDVKVIDADGNVGSSEVGQFIIDGVVNQGSET